jgi:hypothetical protein
MQPSRAMRDLTFVRFAGLASIVLSLGCGRLGFAVAPPDSGDSSDADATDAALDAYSLAVIADSPLAYWRLNDSSTDTARDTMNRYDGVYKGNCVAAPGLLTSDTDLAVNFAAACFVELPLTLSGALPSRSPYSIELLMRPAVINEYVHLFTLQTRIAGGPVDGFAVLDSPTGLYGERVATSVIRATPQTLAPLTAIGSVKHLVVTYDGATLRMYSNGVEQATIMDAAAIPPYSVSGFIGTATPTAVRFNGILDEVALYSTVLPAARIALHAQLAGL